MARNSSAAAARQPARSGEDALASLENLKLNLQATREKLMLVQPDTLSDADHAKWSDEIFKVSVAISARMVRYMVDESWGMRERYPCLHAAVCSVA